MRWPRRIALVLTLGVLAAALPAWVAWHSRDLERVDERGLEVDARPLADPENGALWLDRAVAALDRGDHAQARAALERAGALPEMRISVGQLSLASEQGARPPYLRWPALGELLLDGDLDDALAVVTIGSRIQRARQTTLVHAVLGLQLQQRGLQRVLELAPGAAPAAERARERIAALEAARPDAETWARVWAGEYQQMRGTWAWALQQEAVAKGWPASSYVLHPNRSLQLLADLFRDLQRDSGTPCAQLAPRERDDSRLGEIARALGPNSVGEILIAVAAPGFDGLQRRRCALESTFSAAQLALALASWRGAHGELPERLEQLVPGYFAELPVDGVRGESLRYARFESALYAPAADAPLRFELGL